MSAAILAAGCTSAGTPSAPDTPAQSSTSAASPAAAPLAAHGTEAGLNTVPWSQVGPGWLLATWSPVVGTHPGAEPPPGAPTYATATTTLYLVNPAGGRYPITTFAPPGDKSAPELLDWSGDGSTALFSVTGEPPTAILVDLHTGKQTTVAVDGDPRFTRPNGKALLLTSGGDSAHPFTLKRVDLAGKPQLTYPTEKLGSTFTGDYLPASDGAQLVLGTATGLGLMGNDGKPGPELPIAGQTDCNPLRWWDGSAEQTVLARCGVADSYASRLWQVPIDGGAPTALTAPNDGQQGEDLGDVNAWKLPAGTFVQALGACGVIYLAKLNPDGTTSKITVPDAEGSVGVVGVSADGNHLNLQARVSCGPGQSLLDYDPATNTSTVLVGPPINGGGVANVLAYPGQE